MKNMDPDKLITRTTLIKEELEQMLSVEELEILLREHFQIPSDFGVSIVFPLCEDCNAPAARHELKISFARSSERIDVVPIIDKLHAPAKIA